CDMAKPPTERPSRERIESENVCAVPSRSTVIALLQWTGASSLPPTEPMSFWTWDFSDSRIFHSFLAPSLHERARRIAQRRGALFEEPSDAVALQRGAQAEARTDRYSLDADIVLHQLQRGEALAAARDRFHCGLLVGDDGHS